MSDFNTRIINEFRANDGVVGEPFENTQLLLLHTTGAKSGKERVNPLAVLEDDGRHIVIASKAGAPSHPDWYYNVVANPEVTVELGKETFDAIAKVAEEPERTELYEKMETINPGFTEYKQKTDRTIPVIILDRKN